LAYTEFSEFAKALAVTFQGGRSPAQFTQDLFKAIYLPVADENPVEETLLRTYKSYFYGVHDITTLAKKISDSLDPSAFAETITTETDASVERLCAEFKDKSPNINADNYNTEIAARFQSIIEKAATPKRKKKTSAGKSTEEKAEPQDSLKDRYGVVLVTEAGSVCPGDGCSNSLFKNEDGHLGLLFDVAVIDPSLPDTDTGNLIALCPECCSKFNLNKTPDAISKMKRIKADLLEAYNEREITSDQKVQEGVRCVLEKIPSMLRPDKIDLNYDPVPLRQKIEADNVALYLKAQGHVNVYYPSVHETFQEMGREGKLRFKPFCLQVKMNYLNLKEEGYDQKRIYYLMTKWLYDATNEDWDSCEIVISYFIQKCEVFDVIAE